MPTRLFSSHPSSRQTYAQALTGYAFAGKPRYPESSQEEGKDDGQPDKERLQPPQLSRQGFPLGSPIGQWVDTMLNGREAGEDALAVTKMKGEGDWLLALADGVGGWSENGVDPALFSQALTFHASAYAQRFYACPDRMEAEELTDDVDEEQSPPTSPLNTPPPSPTKSAASYAEAGTPLDILQYAYQSTLAQKEVPAGSATACMLTFDASKGVLRSANLGDSGFLVLRPGSSGSTTSSINAAAKDLGADTDESGGGAGVHVVHHQSKPQTHGFNTPLQLSKLPPEFRFDGSIDSQPSNADLFSCRLRDGDIVLAATDGFWDNVSTSEVLQLVAFIRQKHRTAWIDRMGDISHDELAEERDLASVIAHNLLQYALMCQFSTTKTSPFERDAARHGIHYPGGKVDDVAILTALIVER